MKAIHYDSGPNMTPLVDVVMVILIFLMLAGSFGSAEHYLQSKLPIHAKGPGQAANKGPAIPPVCVDVHVDRNGNASILPDVKYEPDVERVREALSRKVTSLRQLNAGNPDFSVEVVLRPSARTRWAALAPIYDAAVRADCRNISFATAE